MNYPLLHHASLGQGEPLLILHGLFGSGRNWNSLAKRFSEQYRVIRIDLRNHGDSFHHPDMDYALMAEDLEHLLVSLHLEQAHILGHSMGGKVAMKFCHRFPQRVKKLIVADISPVSYQHDHEDVIQPLMAMDLTQIHNRKDADRALSADIVDPQVRQFLLQNLDIKQGTASWKINLNAINKAMPAITGFDGIDDWQVHHFSLFIRGARSDYVTDDYWRLIGRHFDHASLVTLENAGHWLHFEQPDAFYQAVTRFLNDW